MATKTFSVVLMLFSLSWPIDGNLKISKRQISSTPTCGQSLYTGIVNENSPPGTFVVQATATSTTGQQLVWSIQDTTFQRFSINPATGAVSVAGSLARMSMQRSALEFRIRATDPITQLYCESTVRINVLPTSGTTGTGTQPTFGQSSYTFVVGQATYGTPVGQVSITNPVGTTLYLLSGTSSFAINPQTGQITANANLSPGVYTFTVNSQNQYGTGIATVTVQVTSSSTGTGAVTFPQTSYTFSTSSCQAGVPVAQIAASSTVGAIPYYSITGSSLFTVNAQSGQISAATNLNPGVYTFNVVATSPTTGQSATATVTLTVASCSTTGTTGTSPSFSQSSYTVSATSCTPGATIVQVQAGGAPSTYYLSGTSQFSINPSTGMLTASQNLATGTYTFQIIAQNTYGQATATLTINANCGTSTFPSGQYYVTQGTCPAGSQLGSICSRTFG
ncbi:mucin-2-like [Paramacrobiotus metropolitanus]|uniref:mucin-2-like n=1 Tax=Paramacrobiotus metropolitanus TaxID=2943436 RepID=UPI002445D7FE|nr:mucin-2-like [Paramacrobiotus metropolitanus]